ncbi:MAG TPA: ABC transporter permease subunit [Candidatus Limnocylindria bacterium]|jgi:ABC-type transport system involved in multi-copper enzyme maturation permease subunit|nr:ABC transporter permease subunit [Candidatus Limnocylindria bacterium]
MLALTVARLQLQELLRRRLFLVLLLLTIVVIALTTWGFSRIPTLGANRPTPITPTEIAAIASQLLILVMFMFSFVLAFSAVFAAAPAISGEVESGITLALLARPITRLEYVMGKWLGLVATVLAYAIPAAAVQMVLVQMVVGYSPPHPIEFLAFVIGEAVVVLTLSLLLSTRFAGMVGGVTGLILWGLAWMGGIVGGIGLAFDNATLTHVGTASKLILPTDGLWRGAVWSLEPASLTVAMRGAGAAAAANPFFAADPPPAAYVAWTMIWITAVLAFAVWSFTRKEL